MKKALFMIMLAGHSFSAFAESSGFISSTSQGEAKVSSAVQAKALPENAWIVLEGNIAGQLGDEVYEFRDNSGSISVDIDDQLWQGQSISPKNKLRIEGLVDKDGSRVEIDVKKIYTIK